MDYIFLNNISLSVQKIQ